MTHKPNRDATGKTAEERFALIRESFLRHLQASGQDRRELLVQSRRPSELSEEKLVRHWAGELELSVNDIDIAIQRAFHLASELGSTVWSFRYVQPHIVQRCQEVLRGRGRL